MGKWSSMKGKLPELPDDEDADDPGALARLHAGMEERKGLSLKQLVDEFNERTEKKSKLAVQTKAESFELKVLTRCILDALEATEQGSARIAGYNWTPSPEPVPQIFDQIALRAWADAHMPESLRLPEGTLKATVKAALEPEGSGVMPDGVKAYIVTKLSRKKSST